MHDSGQSDSNLLANHTNAEIEIIHMIGTDLLEY